MDTERSLHSNYSHQLSRKSNHEFSDTLLNQLFQEQQPSNFQRNTIPPLARNFAINWSVGYWWRQSGYCKKSTFQLFPSNIKKVQAVIVETPSVLRSRRHRRAAAVIVGPPPSSWSHHRHRGAAIGFEPPPPSSWSRRHFRGVAAVIVEAAAIIVEPPPSSWSRYRI